MGIAERREREKEQRRSDILDAAEKLFFSRGIENTTMDDIAEESELSKGTLYLYFKSRDEVYNGIYLRGMNILKEMFEAALASRERGIEKVRAIGEAYYRFSREEPKYFEGMMSFEPKFIDLEDTESFGFKCHQCAESVMEHVAAAVRTGLQDGTIRPGLDPMQTAYLLWGQSTGVIQIIMRQGEHMREYHQIDPDALIPGMFDLIYHALLPGRSAE